MNGIILIKNFINHQKNKSIRCEWKDNNTLTIKYILPIPNWINGIELLDNNDDYVVFSKIRKKNIKTDNKENKGYKIYNTTPITTRIGESGRTQYLVKIKNYSTIDIFNKENLLDFLRIEKNKIFKEIKSNIVLEKIGRLSKEYNNILSDQEYLNYTNLNSYPEIKLEDAIPF